MDAATLLANTLSGNMELMQEATKQLEHASNENFHAYMHTLAHEMANEGQQPSVRFAAALQFKNAVAARDAVNQPRLSERWLSLPDDATAPLKQSILATLSSTAPQVGPGAAQCVSAVAAVELPAQKWGDLIPQLLQFAQNQDSVALRVHTLQSIGYICEVIDPEIVSSRSNEILTAVVQGARKEETNHDVQMAAMSALYNSLEFIRDNFEREGERNYIMQVVCEATQSPSDKIQVHAFECLVKIMSLYYDKMEFYMERALFGLTLNGMKSNDEIVALQAIEFWSTVCEEEIELNVEAQEAQEYGEAPVAVSKNFAKMALAEILPQLLQLLTEQEEDADDDDWTKAMASGACLELLARDVGDDIVPQVVPFVEGGITRDTWQHREAAVMAFGSILDGPDPSVLAPLVTQALGALIQMLQNDSSIQVRDTVAWTLSKITEVMLDVIDPDAHLDGLIRALVLALNDGSPRIVNSCCSALSNIVAQLSVPPDLLGDEIPTSIMSRYFAGIIQALMPVSAKPTNESNSRSAAYQTIATFVASSAEDTVQAVQNITSEMLSRQEQLLGIHNQLVGIDDRNNWNDIQINICVVLQSSIHKSPAMIAPFADRIMTNLLSLVSAAGKHAGVLEDAFATIGALASALEAGFTKYLEAFIPYLFTALTSFEDWQVAQAAVYVASDIARAIGDQITSHAERLMVSLVDILRSPVVHRQVKPNAITTIGEIALAVGSGFNPYLETVMGILSQAGATAASSNDAAMIEFVWTMREAIVEAFIGILNGLKTADPSPFQQYVSGIMNFLQTCMADEERTDAFCTSTLGLIGDFGDTYKTAVRGDLMQEWVQSAIAYGRQRGASRAAKNNAAYAQKAIKEISSMKL